MQKLTIPLLAISFLLVFGCGSKPKPSANPEIATVVNSYFSDKSKDYAYRTKITVYGHELSGILIAKRISDSIHRVVLSTDFGNTLLDFEIGQNSFKKNTIIEDLDRRIIVNTLRDDFRLLFREQYPIPEIGGISGDLGIFVDEGRNDFNISFRDNILTSISKSIGRKEIVSLEFLSENNTFADKIQIQHHDMKLRIEMLRFAQ